MARLSSRGWVCYSVVMRRLLSAIAGLCLIGAILLPPADNIWLSITKGLLASLAISFTVGAARSKS